MSRPQFECRMWMALGVLLLGTIASALAWPSLSIAASIPSFEDLGGLSDTEMSCEVGFAGLSNNGQVVVGQCIVAERGSPRHAFRWDAEHGMVRIPDLDGGVDSNRANAVSADGSIIAGYGLNSSGFREAYRWTAATGTVGLGNLSGGNFHSNARGISDDGRVIVGGSGIRNGDFEAYRWTEEEGMVSLGYLTAGDDASGAYAASADGSVVAGFSYRNHHGAPYRYDAFRWTEAGGMVGLGESPFGYEWEEALGVTPDGSVIVGDVGSVSDDGTPYAAMRWTESEGMVVLGDLPGGSINSFAKGVSDDGSIVVGYEGEWTGVEEVPTRAFIWDEAHGMRDLRVVLQEEYGLDLTGWTLQSVVISGDGTVFAGRAIQNDNPARAVPWRAVLGTPGDTNLDGTIDLEDLNAVRNHFGDGTLGGARVAGDTVPFDGIVDLSDLNAVRNNFGAVQSAVPEPAAWVLGATIVFCISLCRAAPRRTL